MKVLGLATYPIEAAATRFRLDQFVGPLADRGISLEVRPFLDSRQFAALYRRESPAGMAPGLLRSALGRLRDVSEARGVDAVLVQREAMLLGPPVVEYLIARVLGKPMVLDLDDPTYLRYQSPTHAGLANLLKFYGKTDDLIRWSRMVICGNRSIAEYATRAGTPSMVIPTVVDTDLFRPRDAGPGTAPPVLGWIGTHSTFPYLASIFPVLERLARDHRFRVKVVGSGRDEVRIPGVEVDCLPWGLERELHDFRSIDIGLYPIVEDAWSAGKSGFKAIQYMAVGVPYVVSPVGVCAEIGLPGTTHLAASTNDEWLEALRRLLSDPTLRNSMGAAGRRHAIDRYSLSAQADLLAEALNRVVDEGDVDRRT